jgi:hypothetical protein
MKVDGTLDSTSYTTGSLLINGGMGVGGKITCSRLDTSVQIRTDSLTEYTADNGIAIENGTQFYVQDVTNSTSSDSGAEVISGGLGVVLNASVGGILKVFLTSDATDTLTGALIVNGGASIVKNVYVNGNITTNNTITGATGIITLGQIIGTDDTTSSSTGSLQVTGGIGVGKGMNINNITIRNTTDATSTSTGVLIISGGAGIAKTLYTNTIIPTNLTMTNNITKISIDGTMAENSDNNLSSEKAIKTYVDGKYTKIWLAEDVKASGTNGGTSTSGSWQTRTLNTLSGETADTSVTLSGNQLTLTAGRYTIDAHASSYYTATTKLRIANITDTTYVYGPNVSSNNLAAGCEVSAIAFIDIAATKVFQLQFRSSRTQTNTGMGIAASFGVSEVYAQVRITKFYRL